MLSIDIGNQKVCIVEGTYNKKGQVIITSWGETEYKGEVVVNGEVRDRATLTFLINEIMKTNNMKSKSAVITLNSSDIITRDMKLPDVKLPQLQQIVKNEIVKITGQEADFIIDFAVWEKTDDQMLRVMAYALNQNMVADYYNILKKCKLKPYAFDIHSNAIKKLFTSKKQVLKDTQTTNIMVVDVGYTKINFHGFLDGKCIFNRSELSPVQNFVREILSLNKTDDTIEALKTLDLAPDFVYEDPTVGETCRYMLSRLAEEIQKYNQYVLIHSADKSIPKIYLCGGIASVKNIDLALTQRLKQPVEILKSMENVTIPKKCKLYKICNAAGALIRTKE